MRSQVQLWVGAVLCASLVVPAASWGQAAKGGKAGMSTSAPEIEEIVVTAQKREEKLQDVPIAVTAVSGDVLESAGVQMEATLSRITPNLTVTFNANFVAPYLRGVGTNYANPGLESTVGMYLDDIYLSRASAGMMNFSDVERVEVLKGPQGTLFGRNTSAGAIRIITHDPQPELDAKAAVTYGRYNRVNVEGTVNVPITPLLSARVTYNHDQNDGFVKNIDPTKPQMGDRNTDILLGKLLFKPTDDISIKLAADYSEKHDLEGVGFINLYPNAPQQLAVALGGKPSNGFYTYTGDFPNKGSENDNDLLIWGGELRADWRLPYFTLSSITGFRWNQFDGNADLDTVSIPFQHGQTSLERTEDFSQEAQIVSNNTGRYTYVGGLFYLHEHAHDIFRVFGTSIRGAFGLPTNVPNVGFYPDDPVSLGGDGIVDTDSVAPYGQASYTPPILSDKLTLTAGLRYTWERKELTQNDGFATGILPGGQVLTTYTQTGTKATDFDKWTPKVTLDYTPIDSTMVYFTFSQGFKSGGYNLPAFGKADSVKPETLTAYEVGWKTELLRRVRFNGAGFYYDYKDLVVQRTDQATGGTRVENAAGAEIYGMEGDLIVKATQRLELGGGAGWLHTKFKDYIGDAYVECVTNPTAGGCGPGGQGPLGFGILKEDLSGNNLPNAPEFTGYLRAQYDQPLPEGYGHVVLNSLVNFTTKSYYNGENTVQESDRTLLSANITWLMKGDRYFISLLGDNLLSDRYNTMKTPQGTGGWHVPGSPMTWGIKVGASL